MQPSETSIRKRRLILNEFSTISGLRINREKTKMIKIGAWRDSRIELRHDLNLIGSKEIMSLGIQYYVMNVKILLS